MTYKPEDFPEEDVEYFYKYLPYDDGALKTIIEGTVLFKDPFSFNDPFDCVPCLNSIKTEDVSKEQYRALVRKLGLSPAESIQQKNKIIRQHIKQIDGKEFVRSLVADVGIFCVCKAPLSNLMWAHYARDHKGFVLEFRIPKVTRIEDIVRKFVGGDWILPMAVHYKMDRPRINFRVERESPEQDDHLNNLLFTKGDEWSYEKEYRCIVARRKPGVYHYGRDALLSSVVGGMRMGDNYRELENTVSELNASLNLNVQCYQAKASDTEYKLFVPGHPRLDR